MSKLEWKRWAGADRDKDAASALTQAVPAVAAVHLFLGEDSLKMQKVTQNFVITTVEFWLRGKKLQTCTVFNIFIMLGHQILTALQFKQTGESEYSWRKAEQTEVTWDIKKKWSLLLDQMRINRVNPYFLRVTKLNFCLYYLQSRARLLNAPNLMHRASLLTSRDLYLDSDRWAQHGNPEQPLRGSSAANTPFPLLH